jgi:NUDIX domain
MGFKDKSDLWTICNRGHVHWGTHGAAGFLFCHVPPDGQPLYLLQQRSRWVDHGGTWGFPGGAIKDRESPEMTARRETQEEIGSLPPYRVTGVQVQDCGGGWKFHIVTADVDPPLTPIADRRPMLLDGSRGKRCATSLYTPGSGNGSAAVKKTNDGSSRWGIREVR